MTVTMRFGGEGGDGGTPRRSTPDHEQHVDFKAGRHFVFDDALRLDDQAKHMIEATLDFLPNRIETFSTSAADCECLIAEKLVTAEGRAFVFVREATEAEIGNFHGAAADDDYPDDDGPP